mmetsp:Transcript_9215/g.12558  ORF Transcript_9215/g.12558 Transcript_9215/m.12558 type:complete len:110 (+) Transcript_9215:324-653(+)|eukprot:CAMPEP_0185584204 /NCGR_PEP_ID=MMETSP0434-20130131/30751_1 /TAXON_ID=626734 ORGANISM="Favella taraikaensis, Strain Fe Narragansett Bay" /NCGR_SAMPLE_ID=MMETSP0434 /ASSEMBLY_ACC=CAM_ASM_000379 /LENGTH=109 /DNA_ID=CAMNT_0028203811 /DNA_START=260 /DNA_END=589 /DNA_ORIENTATION=-
MCLSCSPDQPKFTNVVEGYVRVCESLLREFYGNDDMSMPTEAFEECGAWNSPNQILIPNNPSNRATTTYTLSTDENDRLVFPKSEFPNAEAFFNGFAQASIPFMGAYQI